MSERKNAFDNYMSMVLSSGTNESTDNIDDLSNFDGINFEEDLGICRDIFTSKDNAIEADEDAKYSWRENYNFDYNIDPEDYETEEEYLEALDEAHISTVRHTRTTKSENELNTNNDKSNIYSYCKVFVKSSNKQSYYLSGNLSLTLGDRVLIPSERKNIHEIGTVIAVGKCFGYAFPCDINEIKPVIKLLNKTDIANKSTGTSKKDFSRDNIIYEDDYIKVSFIKWEYHDYLAGRARAGTFLFENKYDNRLCMYFKNISVGGFLNQEESMPTALSGKKKVITEISFVFDKKLPEHLKTYNEVEFTLCYGRIKEGYSASSLIQKPLIESDIISIKV